MRYTYASRCFAIALLVVKLVQASLFIGFIGVPHHVRVHCLNVNHMKIVACKSLKGCGPMCCCLASKLHKCIRSCLSQRRRFVGVYLHIPSE